MAINKLGKIGIFAVIVLIFISLIIILYFSSNASSTDIPTAGLILFWNTSNSIPTDWTCISCASGDDFFDRFPYGNSTYGDQGGSNTHTHSISSPSSDAASSSVGQSQSVLDIGASLDTHTLKGFNNQLQDETGDNMPIFRTLRMIRYNSGIPDTLPAGAIAIFKTTTLPANWTRIADFDGNFIRGNDTINSSGGSNTHTYTFNTTDFADPAINTLQDSGTGRNVPPGLHDHNVTGTTSASNHVPTYLTVILAEINSSDAIPVDMIGMFNTTPPTAWNVTSDSGEDFFEIFLLANDTYGETGGVTTHTHSDLGSTDTSNPNNIIEVNFAGGSPGTSSPTHKHTFTSISFSTDNNLPAYTTVIFAQAVDLEHPSISVGTPGNMTNFSFATAAEINYSVSDNNALSSCWWTNSSGTTNTTLTCGVNVTGQTWNEGLNTVIVYANDTSNNENTSSVTFRIDTTSPSVKIGIPGESEEFNFNVSINLNFTVTDLGVGRQSCWYHIDSEDNTTLASCSNNTFNTSTGTHTIYLYSNDTLGNNGSDINDFTISLNAPAITLDFPTNATFLNSNTNIYLNYTATDDSGISACEIWHDLTGTFSLNQTNTGVNSSLQNFTAVNASSDNTYNWNVFCNDTANNGRFSANNFTFTTDTFFPNLTIDTISTSKGSQNAQFNFTVQDTNLQECWYTVRNSSSGIDNNIENTSVGCGANDTQFTVTAFATFNLTVYANDTAGNTNSTTQEFTIESSDIGGGAPGAGGAAIIFPGIGIIQAIFATNFSLTTTNLETILDFVLAKDSVRPRKRSLFLTNKGIEPIMVNLICNFVPLEEDEINQSGEQIDICDYVILPKGNITIPPSEKENIEIEFEVSTPENASFGDRYLYNILAVELVEESNFTLISRLSVSNRVPLWGLIFKWSHVPFQGVSDIEKRAYPVFWIALFFSFIFSGILFFYLNRVGFLLVGFISSSILLFVILTLLLIFL